MAKQTSSIAGRVHGGSPAAPAPPSDRYYPQLEGLEGVHPEVSRAIRTAFDNLYTLRDQVQKNTAANTTSATSAASGGKSTGTTNDPNYATGIHGIAVKAPTDPSSLKDGYTLRYSADQGQFIFDV